MKLYIGNLSRGTTEGSLRTAFESHGQVSSVNIIKDKFSGDSKGFGFVEMPEKAEAELAISHLNGTELDGRAINVSEARPRTENRGSRYGGNHRY
jgi:RNA recognition motif-containing protein